MSNTALADRMVSLIQQNRISSTEVADALGKSGVIPGMNPVTTGRHVAGAVHYVFAHDESNWSLHEQIRDVPAGCMLFVDSFACRDKAIFGDLVTNYLMLYRQVRGIVVRGAVRDVPNLRKHGYPIWCCGFTPLGCFNQKVDASAETLAAAAAEKEKLEGGIAVCDDAGCTVIEQSLVTDETFARLELIELQEDIWGYCVNTLKWSTYDTVCLKKYLTDPSVLPEILREKVKRIPFKK
jgi:4-hydroxy-4-methyl-2-oxoglutarate aldolase